MKFNPFFAIILIYLETFNQEYHIIDHRYKNPHIKFILLVNLYLIPYFNSIAYLRCHFLFSQKKI